MGGVALVKEVGEYRIFVEDRVENEFNEIAVVLLMIAFLAGVNSILVFLPPSAMGVKPDGFSSFLYVVLVICAGCVCMVSLLYFMLAFLPLFEDPVQYYWVYSSRDKTDLIKIKKEFGDRDQTRVCMAVHSLEDQIKSEKKNEYKLIEIANGCK